MTWHVLYESESDSPKLYFLGGEGEDRVVIFDAGEGTLSAPLLPGSVQAHMPMVAWKLYEDERGEAAIVEKAVALMKSGD